MCDKFSLLFRKVFWRLLNWGCLVPITTTLFLQKLFIQVAVLFFSLICVFHIVDGFFFCLFFVKQPHSNTTTITIIGDKVHFSYTVIC